ncbi:MAG: peptidylprolyl isomerase [SAR86 cluster bacterium]|jgi:peptidyl-prolyl cis-trans isomerase D|nr:MAG: peptidylprolyl isomerase [SAR86 cluster bacterium]URQ69090.1 SurA N-terminal domain-containing protein [SAR86 cluster bacterium]
MLESVRNFLTGPRLVFIIAICALPFVFLGTSSLTTVFSGSIGTINGEEVTEWDFQNASAKVSQNLQDRFGEDFDINLLGEEFQLGQIRQELIAEKVLLAEARSIGLINKESIKNAKKFIVTNQMFFDENGMFDEGIYGARVNAMGHTKETYIDLVTKLLASQEYRIALGSLDFTFENELRDLAILLEKQVDLDFIKIDFDLLSKSIDLTSDQIKEFYVNNQSQFFSDEKRSIKYFILNSNDYEDKVTIPNNYIDEAYQNYLSNMGNNIQKRISHIMIDKNNYSNESEAFEIIKKVENEIINGTDFESLVSKYTEDIVTKDTGGDLDYFSADIFPEEFASALESVQLNETSAIVEIETSFHILKVTEVLEQEIKSYDQMKETLSSELIAAESLALMNDDLVLLDDMSTGNITIDQASLDLDKKIQSYENFSLSDFQFELNDPRIDEFIFSTNNINKLGIIDFEDKILVLTTTQITESKLMDYDQVEDKARDLLALSIAENEIINITNKLSELKIEEKEFAYIEENDFITNDSYVNVKRYASLMPAEILEEVFKNTDGATVYLDSNNKDKYIIDIKKFNDATYEEIESAIENYRTFSSERYFDSIASIIDEDLFKNAVVNINLDGF